ncbi:hypothetical protein [Ralstonia solanacearum]|uniref:Uncharacterized protein n=1 Tax=Ralstonia solanacearum TaxID=305 RepID=A0AAE3NK27_RALSL|nr:hypothetical protein [Ralstonia solanacearum]MBB6580547.1 hypothetical protein [Ralstonia solanacearum]MDB0523823.1 hypothetical protein [Ralstonia solanacearum]
MTMVAWSEGAGQFFNPGSSNATGLTPRQYLKVTSRPQRHDPIVLAVQTAKREIERLEQLERDWDGYGSAKPNIDAIKLAVSSLPDFISSAEKTGGWSLPHVSANEDGEVLLEWWKAEKKLTFFFRADGIDYLRAWGADIQHDMDDGELTAEAFPRLWAWLSSI